MAWLAFCDCSKLTDIMIPNGVTIIEGRAFINCASLSNIMIPESVISIVGIECLKEFHGYQIDKRKIHWLFVMAF